MATMKEVCGAVESGRAVYIPESFPEAVGKVIDKARKDRELRLFEYWRAKRAITRRRTLEKIYAGVIDEGIAMGEIAEDEGADGFDWNSLLDFLERLLPIIMQFISLI